MLLDVHALVRLKIGMPEGATCAKPAAVAEPRPIDAASVSACGDAAGKGVPVVTRDQALLGMAGW